MEVNNIYMKFISILLCLIFINCDGLGISEVPKKKEQCYLEYYYFSQAPELNQNDDSVNLLSLLGCLEDTK